MNGRTADPRPVDGRTARRDRNKTAVLDAVIELFAEDNLTPGVHEVAERSGVSLRSVYRYFEDIDDLVAAAITRHVERSSTHFDMPEVRDGSTAERIRRFCRRRVAFFTSVRAVYRASSVRAGDHPQLAERLEATRASLERQTAETFAPELTEIEQPRAEIIGAVLDTLSQFETLEYQYRLRSYDASETADFLADAFTEVLDGEA